MKERCRSVILMLLAAGCVLLSACGKSGETATPGAGSAEAPKSETPAAPTVPLPDENTLVIAISDEVEGLDVQQISYANIVNMLLTEPLIVYSTDLTKLYPSFAESFTLTDEYIEFVLPADAKFSNGNILDAAALKASTERFLAISEYAGDLDTVTKVEVVDARTVRYYFSEPSPYSLATISCVFGGIVDVAAAESVNEWEFNRHPVMNGPYRVEDWVAGSHIVLKRNEYFHTYNPELKNHGAPNFETVVIRFIPNAEECLSALKNGEVDCAYRAPISCLTGTENDPAFKHYTFQQPGVCYLNLNTERGALTDAAVRQALTYAVDRDALNDAVGGMVYPTFGFIAPAQAGYSPEEEALLAEKLMYDPARAKEILAEAGWKDSDGDGIVERGGQALRLNMMLPADRASFTVVVPVLQKQFAAIGADVQVEYYEADFIKEMMRSGEYEIGSRAFEWNDADMLYWCFTEDSGYGWDDAELTALLNRARHVNDVAKRTEVYAEASERLAEAFKAISLFSDDYVVVSKADLDGLVIALDDRLWVNDAVKK
ncbi:MAG: hypothetical protein J5449_12880 [Oscillospiraceae bacterium]|nr:hypothetical protein [Oscillospiraceae bacterium]